MVTGRNGTVNAMTESVILTLFHDWCGLGIRDKESCRPIRCVTRILSNDASIKSTDCSCKEPRHIHFDDVRKQKNDQELADVQSAPHQRALTEWATSIIQLLKLRPRGPDLTLMGRCVTTTYQEVKDGRKSEEFAHGPLSDHSTRTRGGAATSCSGNRELSR